jgi:holo-[acyl-carrier protein] synthase
MMILRSGVDIVEIDRLVQLQDAIKPRFLARVFTPEELRSVGGSESSLAGRFAVKEAVAKALGCGIGLVSWQEIEVLQNQTGGPFLVLHGKALELSNQLGIQTWSISISHTAALAIGFAVAAGE